MFLSVGLPRTFRMLPGMDGVSARRVSMVGRFFMLPAGMMLGCFAVMVGGMGMMLRCLPMVLSCFVRHTTSSLYGAIFLQLRSAISEPSCAVGSSFYTRAQNALV